MPCMMAMQPNNLGINHCADLTENQSYSTACLALTDWASMGASKGPWLSRDSLGLQKGCGSAARPVHWVTLHLAEGSVLSAKGGRGKSLQ